MVIDVCTYNGEKELWDIHYNILKDYVDEFIVVEFDETFSGKSKELSFPMEQYPDVRYVSFSAKDWEKYRELAEQSPNTTGAAHWKREFMQKESIKDALTHLDDDDIIFIGDVDEIWDSRYLDTKLICPIKLNLRVYTYYLNNRSSEHFWGIVMTTYGSLKRTCLNHLRSSESIHMAGYGGWHFTSMGGTESVKKKLTDSYTHETYASSQILSNLEYNMAENKDFLGRNFTYTLDESEWPDYLKENRDKYIHLIK
jgi:hypothetical protein